MDCQLSPRRPIQNKLGLGKSTAYDTLELGKEHLVIRVVLDSGPLGEIEYFFVEPLVGTVGHCYGRGLHPGGNVVEHRLLSALDLVLVERLLCVYCRKVVYVLELLFEEVVLLSSIRWGLYHLLLKGSELGIKIKGHL